MLYIKPEKLSSALGKVLHTDLFKQIGTSAGLNPLSPSFLGLAKLLMMEFVQA